MPSGRALTDLPQFTDTPADGDLLLAVDVSQVSADQRARRLTFLALLTALRDRLVAELSDNVVTPAQSAAQRVEDAEQRLALLLAGADAAVSPSRVIAVDAAYLGYGPPMFTDVVLALIHARAVIQQFGGRITLRLFHDGAGQPLALPSGESVYDLAAEGIDVVTLTGTSGGTDALLRSLLGGTGLDLSGGPIPSGLLSRFPLTGIIANRDYVDNAVTVYDVNGDPIGPLRVVSLTEAEYAALPLPRDPRTIYIRT